LLRSTSNRKFTTAALHPGFAAEDLVSPPLYAIREQALESHAAPTGTPSSQRLSESVLDVARAASSTVEHVHLEFMRMFQEESLFERVVSKESAPTRAFVGGAEYENVVPKSSPAPMFEHVIHLSGSPGASSSSSSSAFGVQYHSGYDAVVSGCSSTNTCIGGEDFAYDASEVLGRYFGTKKAKAVTSFPTTGRKGKGKWETRSQQLTMVAALVGSPCTRCFRRPQVCSGAKKSGTWATAPCGRAGSTTFVSYNLRQVLFHLLKHFSRGR
jgi:hypothetical protein